MLTQEQKNEVVRNLQKYERAVYLPILREVKLTPDLFPDDVRMIVAEIIQKANIRELKEAEAKINTIESENRPTIN